MNTPLQHPDFGNGLTNHEPMVVSALKELGASTIHIARYQAMMAEKIRWVDSQAIAIENDNDLKSWLGKTQNYAGLHAYMESQQQRLGNRSLVNRYVPMLASGITGGALHPVIRLGHAVHDENDGEIVAGLAYWAWAYQSLPFPQADSGTGADVSLATVIEHLVDEVDWPTERINRPTITEEFAVLTALPAYQQLRFKKATAALSFDALRTMAISALWMHDDFTLLHGVTGMLAAERVSQWLDDKTLLLQPMWKALVVAWLSKGLRWKAMPATNSTPVLSLTQLKTLAAHGTRDHTVKLVAACLAYYQQTKNQLFWLVAEREVMNDAQLQPMIGNLQAEVL